MVPVRYPLDVHDDLIQRIRRRRDQFSPGYQRVADYLVTHYEEAAFASAARVAQASGVSESLVVRFASSLGYAGYKALSSELKAMVQARLSLPDRLRKATPTLTATASGRDVLEHVVALDTRNLEESLVGNLQDVFDPIVSAMLKARSIYLVGLRGPAHLAGLFGVLLDKAGASVHVITQGDVVMFDQLRRIDDQDLMFVFTFSRYTARSRDAVRFARSRGATTVVMTDGPNSPAAAESEYVLDIQVATASFQHSYVAAISVMNALVAAWTLRAPERSLESLESLESVIPEGSFLT